MSSGRVAQLVQFLQFAAAIDGAVFRGEGDIDHPGEDHVLVVGIGVEGLQEGFHFLCADFSGVAGDGEDFVAGVFDGACFVQGYVAGFGCDHAFPAAEETADDSLVGLGASGQEKDAFQNHQQERRKG